jgi:hypothetical protein
MKETRIPLYKLQFYIFGLLCERVLVIVSEVDRYITIRNLL